MGISNKMINDIADYTVFINLSKEEQKTFIPIIDFKKIYNVVEKSIFYQDMLKFPHDTNKKHSRTQMYWNWLYNIREYPVCPICSTALKWQKIKKDLSSPYYKTCSTQCGYSHIVKYPIKNKIILDNKEMIDIVNIIKSKCEILDYTTFVNLDKIYQIELKEYIDNIKLARHLKHSVYETEILASLKYNGLKKLQYYYHWVNDIKQIPKCAVCKINDCNWHANAYRITCGVKCSNTKFIVDDVHVDKQIEKLHELTNNSYEYISGYSGSHSKITVKNKNCGCIFDAIFLNLMYKPNYCINHRSYSSTSKGHEEVIEYMQSLISKDDLVINDRKILCGKELDVYVAKYKFAIEYNGVYYHSYNFGTEIDYHYNKSENCDDLGISLFHIYEDQWKNKNIIVKSMISNKLMCNKKVYARKTYIRTLSPSEAKEFFDSTHLAGHTTASLYYGLIYEDNIVSAMSFSKPRFDKKYQWEIIRFSNALFTSVVGSASKLFNHFIKEHAPQNIMTYSSNDIGNGELYTSLGFSFVSRLGQGYFYIDDQRIRHSRHKFQKHKIVNLIAYDENKTEKQIMMDSGYLLVHDAGNKKWELILNK